MIRSALQRKCALQDCRKPFTPRSSMEKWCSPTCGVKLAGEIQRKQARRRKIEGRLKLRTRREWMKLAQFAFNRYIRIRDDALPCVSCGRDHQGQWHAGHYLGVMARPELRFEPDNVHKQCQPCNTHLSGNIALYRAELCRRVGVARVEDLEGDHAPRKYTVDDLKAIIERYNRLAKQLQNSRGDGHT